MCRLCWELQLSIVSQVRHTLCTQSDNLTVGTKHRCGFSHSKIKTHYMHQIEDILLKYKCNISMQVKSQWSY